MLKAKRDCITHTKLKTMVVKKLTLIFLIELNMVISPSQREVVYKVRNAYKVLVYKVRNAYKVLVYKVRNAYKVLVYKVRNAYKVLVYKVRNS